MSSISDEDHQALGDFVVSLEQQIDFLKRERALYPEGATALTSLAKVAAEPCCIVGNASQPILLAVYTTL